MTSPATSGRQLSIKRPKIPSTMTLGRTSQERFTPGSRNLTALSGTIRLTNAPDMMSIAAFSIGAAFCRNDTKCFKLKARHFAKSIGGLLVLIISEITRTANFKIHQYLALDSLYIATGNDVMHHHLVPVGCKSNKRAHDIRNCSVQALCIMSPLSASAETIVLYFDTS